MKIPLLRPLALAAALLVAPSAAEAAFLPAFTGHGEYINPNGGADGIVNFAVYENTDNSLDAADFGGDAGFFAALTGGRTFGTSAALTSSRFIYLFQVANTNPSLPPPDELRIDKLLLGTDIALVTAAGTASGYVFNDNTAGSSGAVTTTNALGTGISTDAGVDGVPGQSGVVAPSFTNVGVTPVIAGFETGLSVEPGAITGFGFDFAGAELAPGNYSTILYIASNSTPAYMPANLSNGANFSFGDTPLPTPEPGSMALIALGLPLIGARCVRRFRRGAAEAAA